MPRPLILILDGGQERTKSVPAFNDPMEYVLETRTIPCIVSGSILEQFERTCPGSLKVLLARFCCFKRVGENIFILSPWIPLASFKETKKYSSYELGVGLACEHKELCTEVTSVDEWKALLKKETGGSWGKFDATVLSSLFIPDADYKERTPTPWVYYMAGHGMYKPHEAQSAVAGIHLSVFKNFVEQIMRNHACSLLVLDTCHGGGRQAKRLMEHMKACEKKYGIKKSFSFVVIGITHDIVFSSRYPQVKRALDILLNGSYGAASKGTFKKEKNIERALRGFIDDALGINSCWAETVIPASQTFFKVTKTPQLRQPGSSQWEILPQGTKHIVSVVGDQPVKIDDDVTAVLIKKGAQPPHLELTTKNHLVFISECDDHEVCAIRRVKALHVEFNDFLRYGFFDLIEPHAHLTFKIDELVALENGKETIFKDLLIKKKHQHSLEGEFGRATYTKNGKHYQAIIGWFKRGLGDLKIPAHAVKKLEIKIAEA